MQGKAADLAMEGNASSVFRPSHADDDHSHRFALIKMTRGGCNKCRLRVASRYVLIGGSVWEGRQ